MGLFSRPDSPYWWLYLETIKRKERTDVRVGTTTTQRRDSRQLAEDVYHRRMNMIAAGRHGVLSARVAITFGTFSDRYLDHVIAHHRGADRERQIVRQLRAAFASWPLDAINRATVLEWRTLRLGAVSPSTANREIDLLKAMLSAAVPTYLEASPLAGLKGLRVPRRETYVLDLDAERRLLGALSTPDRAIVICGLDTLMRLSDVLNLRREQDRGRYLVVEDPKVQPYKVPVSSRLRAALDALPKAGPYFFAHRRHAENPRDHRGGIQSMLERACRQAGVPYGRRRRGLTFHGLRHTGATRLAEQGVSLRIIQEIGGWRSLRQIERYAHPSEVSKRAAVELIGGAAVV